jgi:hypothetical protein
VESNKVSAGGKNVTKSDPQFTHEGLASRATLGLAGAVLVILLGVALQLDIFGYGHFNSDSFWFISMIAGAVWDIVATRMDMPTMNLLIRWWPLILVSAGLAMLLSFRPASLARATSHDQAKGRNDAQSSLR